MRCFPRARWIPCIAMLAMSFTPSVIASTESEEASVRRAIAQLNEGDWVSRWGAIQVLAASGSNEAIAPLRRLHGDEREDVWLRGRALVALAQLQPAVILPVATKLAEDAKDKRLQAAAVEAIGVTAVPRGKDALLKALQSDSPMVKNAAVEAFARVAGAEAMPMIEAALRSNDGDAIRPAVRGLSYIYTPSARTLLWTQLANENESAASEAIAAAGRLRSPDAVPGLLTAAAQTKRDKLAAAARRALASYPAERLAAPLAAALRDGDESTRKVALSILSARPIPDAIAAVADLASSNLLDPSSLAAAFDLIGQHDGERFRDLLVLGLSHESPDVRRAAARQVDRIGGEPYTPLRPLLTDPDPGVRAETVQTLRRSVAPPPAEGIVSYLAPALEQVAPSEATGLIALVRERTGPDDRDAAIAALARFLAVSASRNDAYVAASHIANDDGSRRAVMAAMGFVTTWRAIGPFGDAATAAERIDRPLAAETATDLSPVEFEGRTFSWIVLDRPGVDGGFDPGAAPELVRDDRRGGVLVLAVTLDVPSATPAKLRLSTSGAAVDASLNGARITTKRDPGEIVQDVQLQAGANRLVLKLGGSPEQWILYTRFADEADNALAGVTFRTH